MSADSITENQKKGERRNYRHFYSMAGRLDLMKMPRYLRNEPISFELVLNVDV